MAGRIVGSVDGVQAAQGRTGELAAIAPRGLVGWRAPIIAALLASALAAALVATLAGVRLQGSASVRHTPAPSASRASTHNGLSSVPLTAQGPVSRALGANNPGYRLHGSGGGFSATSPAQRLTLGFDRSGVSVSSGAVHVGMSLRAVGYGGVLANVGAVTPRASANRIVYELPDLEEWYANGPLGLEQGFTIPSAPAAHAVGALTLALALSGNARATLASGGQSVMLTRAGEPALRYTGVTVTDARGRPLHAWLQLHGRTLLLRVDARGARYPLRIDPFIQQAELTGSEEVGAGSFGYSVALSSEGNTALIGGPYDNEGAGAAWVFTREGATWTQQGTKLTGAEEIGKGHFGWSVALSSNGNTAMIGGPTDNGSVGAAWVFTREGTTWTQQGTKLTGAEEIGKGRFGYSVALSSEGNTAAIGGPYDNTEAGAAWVFTRAEATWTQQGTKLTGAEEVGPGLFGYSVALSSAGNTAVIGGPFDNTGVGATWVFTRAETTWTQQGTKLTGSGEVGEAWFGYSVALSSEGNIAMIGGLFDNADIGAAWVFTREGTTWTQQGAKLTDKEGQRTGWFGASVALSAEGNTALIGGIFAATNGEAWVFTSQGTTWTQQGGGPLTGKGEVGEGHFGASVALSANAGTALIGGPVSGAEVGAAWAFALEPPTVVTLAASSVTTSGATLNGTVNPNGGKLSSCDFEYGETEAYGSSVPCSSLPGAGESAVGVSGTASGLNGNTTYHFRIVATNPGGTSYGADQTFATLAQPPDFGRCVKVVRVKEGTKYVSHGGFTTKVCTIRSETNSGEFEWHPGVVRAAFTSKLKTGTAALETAGLKRVSCTSESSSGEYSGLQEVKGVVIKFGGCEMLGQHCTTPGLEEGELETKPLEGKLGWQVKALGSVGLDLTPVGGAGLFLEYTCAAVGTVTVDGSLIAQIGVDKSSGRTLSVLLRDRHGFQEPEHLEGGPIDALTAFSGETSEPLGVYSTSVATNQEAVEVNTKF